MAEFKAIKYKVGDGLEVILKSPQISDAEEILKVMSGVFAESEHLLLEADEFNYTTEQEADIIRGYLDHPDKLWIVAAVNGKIVGCLTFAPGARRRISHSGEFGISLTKDCQGLGIGRLFMRALIEWAEANPRIEAVRLRVHARNTIARKLYESEGFVIEGCEVRGVKFSDGRYDDVYAMARPAKPIVTHGM